MLSNTKFVVLGVIGIFLIVFTGAAGYMYIEGAAFIDALYMTIITITTVGFKEVFELPTTGKVFTIIIIILGTGFIAYALTQIIDYLIAGEVKKSFWRKKMDKKIEQMENHYIICGYGRMGRFIAERLRLNNENFAVIEVSSEIEKKGEELGEVFVFGDATKSDVLKKAGIDRARGLVSVVDSDARNVYITLTAKWLNPDLHIITKANDEDAASKMRWAGASKVVSPKLMGGKSIANSILKPNVSEFLELALSYNEYDIDVGEFSLNEPSILLGKKIYETEIRKIGIIIIAIKKEDKTFIYNPGPNQVLEKGDTLIVLGRNDDFVRLYNLMRG